MLLEDGLLSQPSTPVLSYYVLFHLLTIFYSNSGCKIRILGSNYISFFSLGTLDPYLGEFSKLIHLIFKRSKCYFKGIALQTPFSAKRYRAEIFSCHNLLYLLKTIWLTMDDEIDNSNKKLLWSKYKQSSAIFTRVATTSVVVSAVRVATSTSTRAKWLLTCDYCTREVSSFSI